MATIMATPDDEPLDPVQVRYAILDLIRLAATWELGRGKGDPETRQEIEATLKRLVPPSVVAKAMAELSLGRVSEDRPNVAREIDLKVAPLVDEVAQALRAVSETEPPLPDAMVLREQLSALFRDHGSEVEASKIQMRVADANGRMREDPREWIRQQRGPIEAAKALVSRHYLRARAYRDIPGMLADRPLGAQELRAERRGVALGTSGPLSYVLRALGYDDDAVERACMVLLQAQALKDR